MSNLAKLEKDVMRLTPVEREHLALAAWESLGDGSDPDVNKSLDHEGIAIAKKRDREVSSGEVNPIGHYEFLRRISSDK